MILGQSYLVSLSLSLSLSFIFFIPLLLNYPFCICSPEFITISSNYLSPISTSKSLNLIISAVRCLMSVMTNLQSLLQTVQSSLWYPEIIRNGLWIYSETDKKEETSKFRTLGTLKEEKYLWMLPKRHCNINLALDSMPLLNSSVQ